MGSVHPIAAKMRLLLLCPLFFGIAVGQRFGGQHAPFNSFRGPRFGFGRPAPQQNSFFGPGSSQSFNSRPSFSSRPTFDSRPSFSSRPTFNSRPAFESRPSFNSRPASGGRPGPSGFSSAPVRASGGSKGNHVWNGKNYLLTWKTGQRSFTHSGARQYCASQGMRIISLDSREKTAHFLDEVRRDNAKYVWAAGVISSDARTLRWENGRSEPINQGDDRSGGFWSSRGKSGPQPETGGECLAILNNVYNDGVKFHDVACNHEKPTICEE